MILKTFKKYQNKWDYPLNVLQINVTSQSVNRQNPNCQNANYQNANCQCENRQNVIDAPHPHVITYDS